MTAGLASDEEEGEEEEFGRPLLVEREAGRQTASQRAGVALGTHTSSLGFGVMPSRWSIGPWEPSGSCPEHLGPGLQQRLHGAILGQTQVAHWWLRPGSFQVQKEMAVDPQGHRPWS